MPDEPNPGDVAEPCWYVDREPWEEAHHPTEAAARADADGQAAADDNPPHPVRRHPVPCVPRTCTNPHCGALVHVLVTDADLPDDCPLCDTELPR